jgi:hypothetical protein
MNAPAIQDTDSGTGEVITPGEPVDHVDMIDGQSAGSIIEPPAEDAHVPGETVSTKPGELSRTDIYDKAKETRDIQDAVDAEEATPEQRAHIARMNAEASGVEEDGSNDPFDGDGQLKEGWVETGAAPAQVSAPAEPVVNAPQIPQQTLDPNAETVTIIIYGEKREVPRAEIDQAGGVVNYQKNAAADERMRRVSTYEASLRSYDQELQTRAAQIAQQPQATDLPTADPAPPPTGEQGDTVNVQSAAERLVNAMYSGDREAATTEAAEVLSSFRDDVTRSVQTVAQPVAQGPTPQEQQLAHDRAATQERERLEANTVFVNEFSDLQSGVLRTATLSMVQAVQAEPIMYGRPLAEVTREAGMRVRADVYGDSAPPAPQPLTPAAVVIPAAPAPGTDLAGRMALKSRTVVQPLIPASGRFTDAPATAQKTESNSEYINRMRAESRGQPKQ